MTSEWRETSRQIRRSRRLLKSSHSDRSTSTRYRSSSLPLRPNSADPLFPVSYTLDLLQCHERKAEYETSMTPGQWFTNRQTEELCKLIGVPNRINPLPTV